MNQIKKNYEARKLYVHSSFQHKHVRPRVGSARETLGAGAALDLRSTFERIISILIAMSCAEQMKCFILVRAQCNASQRAKCILIYCGVITDIRLSSILFNGSATCIPLFY